MIFGICCCSLYTCANGRSWPGVRSPRTASEVPCPGLSEWQGPTPTGWSACVCLQISESSAGEAQCLHDIWVPVRDTHAAGFIWLCKCSQRLILHTACWHGPHLHWLMDTCKWTLWFLFFLFQYLRNSGHKSQNYHVLVATSASLFWMDNEFKWKRRFKQAASNVGLIFIPSPIMFQINKSDAALTCLSKTN